MMLFGFKADNSTPGLLLGVCSASLDCWPDSLERVKQQADLLLGLQCNSSKACLVSSMQQPVRKR